MQSHRDINSWNLAVMLAALALCDTADAQSVDQGDLERCASQETPELKLTCFEALAAVDKSSDAPLEPDQTDTAGIDTIAADPPAATVPAAATNAAPELPPVAAAVPPVTADAAMAPSPAEPMVEPREQAADTTSEAVVATDNLGNEQLDRQGSQDDEGAANTATVIEVSKGRHKILYFHLANGQIWRQIEGRRFRYPTNGEFDVIITRGMMGEYRLRLDEKSPMTRIRRVR